MRPDTPPGLRAGDGPAGAGPHPTPDPRPPGAARPEPVVEHRGIDLVPADERAATVRALGWMWAGGLCNVEYVAYGFVVGSLGLSLAQAVAVIVLANATYLLAGLASLPGPAAGTATFAISRAPFGRRGAQGVSLLNWVSMIAYETEGLFLVALAVLALLAQAGVHRHTWTTVAVVLGAGGLGAVLPLLGHGTILRVLRAVTVPFALLFLALTVLALPRLHPAGHGSAGWVALSEAFAFSVSATGFGWVPQASDFSRYLPAATPRRRLVGVVAGAGAVPSVLLMVLGAVLYRGLPAGASTDPVTPLHLLVPGWFLTAYLLVAGVQLLAINALDVYSSGLTLQAVGVPVSRLAAVAVDAVLSTGLTLAAVLASSFNQVLQDLITLLIVWTVPWGAVYLVDWWLRRGRYDPAVVDGRPGTRALGLPGLVTMALGMVAAACCVDTPVWTGPLSRVLGGADLSVPVGALVAGAGYWAWARRGARLGVRPDIATVAAWQ